MTEDIKATVERVAREAEEAEVYADPQAPLPPGVRVTRGHDRTRVLQIRLSEDEYRSLADRAARQDVPASTLARDVLLRGLVS